MALSELKTKKNMAKSGLVAMFRQTINLRHVLPQADYDYNRLFRLRFNQSKCPKISNCLLSRNMSPWKNVGFSIFLWGNGNGNIKIETFLLKHINDMQPLSHATKIEPFSSFEFMSINSFIRCTICVPNLCMTLVMFIISVAAKKNLNGDG